ncbi:MAG: hypothetical protein HRT89_12165 [Lentisphaeria bacterium]|nr:C45 family peptidase [Lentisphaeria bacterium]NQZ68813.1 hypothetical protein [Lentisphaeria bacterium]
MAIKHKKKIICILLLLATLGITQQKNSDKIIYLKGSPEEMGKQHALFAAKEIKLMISEYIGNEIIDGKLKKSSQTHITTMKESLPKWFLDELNACATATGIDPDVLLYAQCEGDIKSLPGCTTYVAFGSATHDGAVQFGRNFDYYGLDSTKECARIFVMKPSGKGNHSFISIGWTGILGGWTFYNDKGLFVANNLGGFNKKDPKGIPTLIMLRIIAQKAATVEEGIALIKKYPRMRGQAIIIGHIGDPEKGIKPSASVVLYDAEKVVVKPAVDGFAFHSSVGTDKDELLKTVKANKKIVCDSIKAAGNDITLHSVAINPAKNKLWVAHGTRFGSHKNNYISFDIKKLLNN